jgi:hypothetical protein
MNRRNFLQSIAGLTICRPTIFCSENEYTIDVGGLSATEFGGVSSVEVPDFSTIASGGLDCYVERSQGGASLVLSMFLKSQPKPGVVDVRRVVPSELLRGRLAAVGLPTRDEGQPIHVKGYTVYPWLAAEIDFFPQPIEIAKRLKQVLAGCDPKGFYFDPGW